MKFKKRDGRIVDFNENKIVSAVMKAYIEVYGADFQIAAKSFGKKVAELVCEDLDKNISVIDIEEIQNKVENTLIKHAPSEVAKAYITYRYRRSLSRNEYAQLMDDVREKLSASNVQNQNANLDEHSFGGRIGEMTDMVMKRYALDYCMSEMSRKNHLNNEIYIHDLSHYAIGDHNCLTIPFDELLAKGFNTRQTDVRPAQSVSTAFQLVAVIFQLQSLQQFGGVSASHIDWTMVPYVRKSFMKHYKDGIVYVQEVDIGNFDNRYVTDETSIESELYKKFPRVYKYALDMTTKEIYQAVEGLYHNLNTLQSRSGNQLPFSSINYGTCTLTEGRMVTKALLDVLIKGVGKLHKTSVFPCGIFQCMKGVNRKPDDPNYDLYRLALRSTAQRLYPNYANCDWSGNEGYDKNNPKSFFSTINKTVA